MSSTGPKMAPELPPEVTQVLDDFMAAARDAFGEQLESVVLFGSAAEGALRATSDVNVILVLRAFERERAERLRETVRLAHAAVRLRVMFLLAEEVAGAAEAFAQKFDDVRRRHRVLWGRDPFVGLNPSRAALVTRINQVLLNLTLRLRATYVERGLHEEQLVAAIAAAAAPLRTAAASLLELEGRRPPSPKSALRELALSIGGPAAEAALLRMSEARETGALPPGVAGETLIDLVELARALRTRLRALG
jgi:predicted nucleotidyltransferase